jgi:sugar phosphate isomerase/epimerase
MAKTRTGEFAIGFRSGQSPWQKDTNRLIAFAQRNGFEGLDVSDWPAEQIEPLLAAGLRIGSVDLKRPWPAIMSADAKRRKQAIAAAAEHIQSVAALGIANFFCVVLPENDAAPRRENFALAVEGFGQLAAAIHGSGARIVIEGWPASPPYYSSVVCTPETYREFFTQIGSESLAINFDPSHLIRMGIDPLRFLGEFASRVGHVHAKDTLILSDGLYEYGNLQSATLAKPHAYGGHHWRYTIPGRGETPWPQLLGMLKRSGYGGLVSVELEDEDFQGSEDAEQRGLIESREFLESI